MYDIIFDDITAEALKKFLKKIGDTEIKRNLKREDIVREIKEKLEQDKVFNVAFCDFFKEIEKAGRKDFWFMELPNGLSDEGKTKLISKISALPIEEKEIYIPTDESSTKYFSLSKSSYVFEVKVIRKKIIKEPDNTKNKTEEGYLYVAYKITEIRHVSYYQLNLTKKTLVVGVDVWQSFNTKEKLKEIEKDVEYLFGREVWDKKKYIDLKSKSKFIFDLNNVITKELKEKINDKNQSASFSIDTERINVIKKDLKNGNVKLENLKTNYIEQDIRNNAVFQAAETKSIGFTIKGGKGVIFYYSDLTEEYEYYKFDIYATEARIKFSNDHTTLNDLEHVFSKII